MPDSGPVLTVAVADLHVNSTVALCPPEVKRADGGTYKASRAQRWIWDCWLDLWQRVAAWKAGEPAGSVLTILAGDAMDLNQHTHSQLIEPENTPCILKAAKKVLQPCRQVSDSLIMLRGTPAHVGTLGQLEESLAKELKADRDSSGDYSWYHWLGDVGGVLIDAAHHPMTSGRLPNTIDAGAGRHAFYTWAQYMEDGEAAPDVVLRGHTHHKGSGDKNTSMGRVRMFQLPPWMLTDAYGRRLGAGRKVEPPGALWLLCHDGGFVEQWMLYKPQPAPVWRMDRNAGTCR